MSNTNQQSRLPLSVTLMVGALKLHDRELVESCEKILVDLLGCDSAKYITTTAIIQIFQIDSETYHWIWQNIPKVEYYLELKEIVVANAIQTLISKGFVIGQDFSAVSTGKILIEKQAKIALMGNYLEAERLLVKRIFHVPV
ncbi:MAG: hypothetical protein WA919_01580 [Coleofasciculaceae cyanobacterium]